MNHAPAANWSQAGEVRSDPVRLERTSPLQCGHWSTTAKFRHLSLGLRIDRRPPFVIPPLSSGKEEIPVLEPPLMCDHLDALEARDPSARAISAYRAVYNDLYAGNGLADLDGLFDDGDTTAAHPLSCDSETPRRRRGRPPGSRNRKTLERFAARARAA